MRFLYVFGYCTPAQFINNERHGWDDEDSCACFIDAGTEKESLARGRDISERFVAYLFVSSDWTGPAPSWRCGNFAHWIEHDPPARFSEDALATLPVVAMDEDPDFAQWAN